MISAQAGFDGLREWVLCDFRRALLEANEYGALRACTPENAYP